MRFDLSVVIVTYNTASLISACLDSVLCATQGRSVQIIVVDSGSTDEGPEIVAVKYPKVLLLQEKNIGFSAANNVALPLCRGEKILLLNPDAVVNEHGLTKLTTALDDMPEVGAVGPGLRSPDGSIQDHSAHNLPTLWNMCTWLLLLDKLEWKLRFGGRRIAAARALPSTLFDGFTLLHWERDKRTLVPYLSGACLMLRRSVVGAVGYLDADSPLYLDDLDYCRRIQNKGWALLYLPEAKILHYGQQSSDSFARNADFYALLCSSIWLYLKKHHGRATALSYRFVAGVAGLLRFAVTSAALHLTGGSARSEWLRQRQMSAALLQWAAGRTSGVSAFTFAPVPDLPKWTDSSWVD